MGEWDVGGIDARGKINCAGEFIIINFGEVDGHEFLLNFILLFIWACGRLIDISLVILSWNENGI